MLISREDKEDNKENRHGPAPFDNYLQMDENQKDAETQKAVVRLQKRIQEILYLLDAESNQSSGSDKERESEL